MKTFYISLEIVLLLENFWHSTTFLFIKILNNFLLPPIFINFFYKSLIFSIYHKNKDFLYILKNYLIIRKLLTFYNIFIHKTLNNFSSPPIFILGSVKMVALPLIELCYPLECVFQHIWLYRNSSLTALLINLLTLRKLASNQILIYVIWNQILF